MRRLVLAAVLWCAPLAGWSSAMAAPPQMSDDEDAPGAVSRAVVEPTAPSAGKLLNDALGHLARDPRNVGALLEAGNAALALGDNEAALGFFTRADQISPANATVKVAIAGARLHLDDPVEALRWYAEAEKAGADPSAFALDRGLAFDLVGDNSASIAQYRLVLARSRDPALRDEATRREALSLAIGGDRRGADLALLPLLQRQDRAAWRTHIFVLAIGGRADEAVSVAQTTMPADLAASISPYLRFMVKLTPAQQAAVASLGRFPRAADIGRDDPRVMAYSAMHPRAPLAVAAPVVARALPSAADLKAAHRRKGAPVAVASAAVPAALPDVVMPAPPPVLPAASTGPAPAPSAGHAPPVVARIAPVVPSASRDTSSHRSAFDLAQASDSARTPTPPPLPAPSTPVSPRVPQPAVLSKLDMPPPAHRTAPVVTHDAPTPPISTQYFATLPRATAATAPAGPAMAASPVVQPTPAPAPAPAQADAASGELPPISPASPPPSAPVQTARATLPTSGNPVPQASEASPPARFDPPIPEPTTSAPASMTAQGGELAATGPEPQLAAVPAETTQHAVVQAVSSAKAAQDAAANERAARAVAQAAAEQAARETARIKAAKDKAAADLAAKEQAAEQERLDKIAREKAAKDKAAKAKSAKAAQDADDEAALEPCKPATTTRGRKGKAKAETAHADKGRSAHAKAHGGKGRKASADDSDTCAPVATGDRPDGPGDVSRDSDSEDGKLTTRNARKDAKSKGRNGDKDGDKGRDSDKSRDSDSDKPEKGAEKAGRKAHYASRIWVQVLTGGDRDKMAGEWRAMVRKAHGLRARKAYLTPWHSNFRLLTGPFDSDADAQAFIAELRKDGVSGFEWTSPAGQAIDSLGS